MNRLFVPSATSNVVTVSRSSKFKLEMSPAEVEKATKIVGIALSMDTLAAVPEFITHSPFVIRFFEDGMYALERKDQKGSIPFREKEGDDLIICLNDALAMAINEKTVGHMRPGQPARVV